MRIEQLILNQPATTRITDKTGSYGIADVRAMTDKVKCYLLAKGICKNDRVVLFAENGVRFIASLFGILAAGAAAVPVDAGLSMDAVNNIVRVTGAVALLNGTELPEAKECSPATAEPLTDTDPAFILFSSGTTGQPKGIVLSHRAIINNMKAIADYLQPGSEDVFYIAKSMVHSSTITGEILLAIYAGAGIVALPPAVPFSQTLKRVEEHRASIMCIPPSLLHFVANDNYGASRLQSLRIIHVSGSIINKNTFRKAQQKLPNVQLYNGYGLTEASPRVAQTCGSAAVEFGSIGKPITGVQVEIRKEDGITLCPPGQTGELYVQSNAMMDGYWVNGATDSSMLKRGWLATGDLGYMMPSGDLVVTGRKDDMIITSSHNVFPNDVEEVMLRAGEIDDCMVFAVEDEVLGQRIVCAYTSSATNAGSAAFNTRLRTWCGTHLSNYQVPKNFYHWEQIPVNSNGKRSRTLAVKYLIESSQPQVSVVIPVYNQTDSLQVVLRFFNQQSFPASRFEVIVVDDGSQQPVAQFININDYHYKLLILRTANQGRAAARNRGVDVANGELIVFCDADRIPGPDFIQSHVQFHARTPNAAAVGCPWDCFLGAQKIKTLEATQLEQIKKFSRKPAYYSNISALFIDGKTSSGIAWAAFLVGNSSIRKADLLTAGGFDENFRNWGFEHFELAIRLLQHHIGIYLCEQAGNYHIPHARSQQQLQANIRESISLLAGKYPGTKMHLLAEFVGGNLSLQQFEQQFADGLHLKGKQRTQNLKFQNI